MANFILGTAEADREFGVTYFLLFTLLVLLTWTASHLWKVWKDRQAERHIDRLCKRNRRM